MEQVILSNIGITTGIFNFFSVSVWMLKRKGTRLMVRYARIESWIKKWNILKYYQTDFTWQKYSNAIRRVHSMQHFSGRVGFETSAHLIIIRLARVTFSGSRRTDISAVSEKGFRKGHSYAIFISRQMNVTTACNICFTSDCPSVDPALLLHTFTNFARCSKCFVISVAKIISMTFCRIIL